MRTLKNIRILVILALVLVLAMFTWGCNMAETKMFQPKPLDGMKEVPVSEDSEKLDAEAIAFFRDRFSIESARYYQVVEIPWIAISKSVYNQMAEKSVQRKMFKWYEPGKDFIEIYTQCNNSAAFAVAMPKGTNPSGAADKLIGFYILRTNSAPGADQGTR